MRTWPALDIGPLAHPDLFQAALLDYGVAAAHQNQQKLIDNFVLADDDLGKFRAHVRGKSGKLFH